MIMSISCAKCVNVCVFGCEKLFHFRTNLLANAKKWTCSRQYGNAKANTNNNWNFDVFDAQFEHCTLHIAHKIGIQFLIMWRLWCGKDGYRKFCGHFMRFVAIDHWSQVSIQAGIGNGNTNHDQCHYFAHWIKERVHSDRGTRQHQTV